MILVENENKRLNFRLPLLICFALYATWQMGVVYFSGETLSLDGRAPLPVEIGNLTILIAAGYILSILVMVVLPRIIVWAERITALVALASALALFLPVSPGTLAVFYYLQCFCCLFMIGFETAIITNLFSEKTAIIHMTVAYGVGQFFIALLQNDFYRVPFPVFRLFTVIALSLMLLFFFKLPTGVWPRHLKKSDGFVAPKSLFAGVFMVIGLSCFSTLFGVTVAENITHGLSALYGASAVYGIFVFFLWKRYNITLLRCASVLLALSAMGFIIAIASLFVPALALLSCVLLGAGIACCWMNPFFCILLAKRHPSRYIAPAAIGIAFITVLIHTAFLEAMRDNVTALYIVYLVIAVGLAVLYLILEPYLLYSFRSRTLQDIIGVVAEDPVSGQDEGEPAPALEPAKPRPLLLRTTPQTTAPLPKEAPPHEQRIKNLGSQALTPLTRREYQVADAILRGLRRSEIVKELKIEADTVNNHRKAIYSKFGIHSRQELFRLAETLDREWER